MLVSSAHPRRLLQRAVAVAAAALLVAGCGLDPHSEGATAGAPDAVTMGWVGALALSANVISALLLLRFRDGDANVRSVWLCSRNDAIGNVAVLCAAGIVAYTGTKWADLAVAAIMASLFLSTAASIIRQARGELRAQAAA